ncbi:MAG TPA: gliding motility-associated C-terminal domain-containing protein, partial [Bacteroidetes bacterium]|nr:gliding motility-associated C-terminal domain-containing protein [Bacteroidota bacterium]
DKLVIPAISAFPGTKLVIYNRWGGLVYESEDYQNDWDGRHSGTGEMLADGTYFYVLTLGNTTQNLKGYITLMR